MGTLHEDIFTFMTVYHYIILRIKNVLDENCIENQNTYLVFSYFFSKIAPFMR
jgi:hypothetical protein